jgi:hypothetical protein
MIKINSAELNSAYYAVTCMHAVSHAPALPDLLPGSPDEGVSDCQSATADHFDESSELSFRVEDSLRGSGTDSTCPEDDAADYLVDDVTYDSVDDDSEEESQFVDGQSTGWRNTHNEQMSTAVESHEVLSMMALFPTQEPAKYFEQDYDWALIQLSGNVWFDNEFICPESHSRVTLSTVADSQPTLETPVFILTSGETVQKGLLQPGETMLGGISGIKPTKLWTLILSGQNCEFRHYLSHACMADH